MMYLIFNFKENKVLNELLIYEEELRKKGQTKSKIILCPSTPFISIFKGKTYELGAQDVSIYPQGAYTGETSAKQLASLNVKYVLVGHSERRKYFQEQEETLIKKIGNSFAHGMQVIFCVGESQAEYEASETYQVLEKQLATVLNDFTREEIKNIIIAYEPIWAIGTGLTPTKEEINETTLFIKKIIQDYYELKLPVLYGGSVNSSNILEFSHNSAVDGFLVGGATLDIEEFNQIIDIFN